MEKVDFNEQEPDDTRALVVPSDGRPSLKARLQYHYTRFIFFCLKLSEWMEKTETWTKKHEGVLSAMAILTFYTYLAIILPPAIYPLEVPDLHKTDPFALDAFNNSFSALKPLTSLPQSFQTIQTTTTQPLLDILDAYDQPLNTTLRHQLHTLNTHLLAQKHTSQALALQTTKAIYTTERHADAILTYANLQTYTLTSWLRSRRLSTTNQRLLDARINALTYSLEAHTDKLWDMVSELDITGLEDSISSLQDTGTRLEEFRTRDCNATAWIWKRSRPQVCDFPVLELGRKVRGLEGEVKDVGKVVGEAKMGIRKVRFKAKMAVMGKQGWAWRPSSRGELVGSGEYLETFMEKAGRFTGLLEPVVWKEREGFVGMTFV